MLCPRCQTPNRSSAKFCDNCGYELPSVAPVAREIFEDKQQKSCNPRMAPTADLNGIDKTNDSSFENKSESVSSKATDEEITGVIEDVAKDKSDPIDQKGEKSEQKNPDQESENTDTSDSKAEIASTDATSDSTASDIASSKTEEMEIKQEANDDTAEITAVMDRVNSTSDSSASSYTQKTYTTQSADKKNLMDPTTKRNIFIALGTIAVIALILVVTYAMQLWGGVTVPDVMGLSEAEAKTKIEDAGFSVETENICSDEVEGIVIAMTPEGGQRTAEGSKVKLSISMKRVVPDIISLSQDDAKKVMEKNGFTNVEYVKVKSDETENTVVSTSPEVNTRAKSDARITVSVAEPYTVPDVSGLSQDEAKKRIEEAGFVASFETQYNETIDEGKAISSEPAKDTAAKSGSSVKVYIAERRSTKLVQLTKEFFSATSFFTINGSAYELGSLQGAQWTSGGTVAFTITARQYQTVTWFDSTSETRYGDYETIQGSISYDDNDNIIAITPSIKQGI